MAIAFSTYLIRPLVLGGAGQIRAAATVSGDTLERIVVKLGLAQSASWDADDSVLVEVPTGDTPGDGGMHATAFHDPGLAHSGIVATFFAKLTTGGWVLGPVVTGIDLEPHYTAAFPWLKTLVISLLKQAYDDAPPKLGDGRELAIRTAFPRDSHSLPALSVQVTAVPTGLQTLGDMDEEGVQVGAPARKMRGYNVNIDLISWTGNPEEREDIAPWLGNACSVLADTLPFFGAHEPTFSVNESEDFDTLKVPAFLVTGSLNFTAWSELSYPVPTSYGHLELIQEVPYGQQ